VKKSEIVQEKKNIHEKKNYSELAAKETEQKLKNSIRVASEFKHIIEKNNLDVHLFF
jgi:hypothetical protein